MNPKAVGERSEAKILSRMIDKGWPVLLPFGDNQRYDFVAEFAGGFQRIQCKTGRVKAGVILASTSSTAYHRGGKRRSYRGSIDYFAIYVPKLDNCYLVPVNQAPTAELSLRLQPTKNGQRNKIRLAADFEL